MIKFETFQIFQQFPKLQHYIGTKELLFRPPQYIDNENVASIQKSISCIQEQFSFKKIIFLAQIHSAHVEIITEKNKDQMHFADAAITNLKDISLNIVVADCVPLLVYDSQHDVIAVIHAGWKGSKGNITRKTLELMRQQFISNAEHLWVGIGPAICGNCYKVEKEVAKHFPEDFSKKESKKHFFERIHYIFGSFFFHCIGKDRNIHRCTKKFCRFFQRIGKYLTDFHLTPPEKYFLDLKAINKQELLDFGIPEHHIEVSNECTFESPQKYFSYRRTPQKANFVCGIGMR